MSLLPVLIFLFIVLPWLELALLFKVSSMIGAWNTFAVVILTGVVGAALARQQGLHTVQRIRAELNEQKIPADALLHGFLIFCAGLLLITPGLLTDSVGFALLIPPVRTAVRNAAGRYIRRNFQVNYSWEARPKPDTDTEDREPDIIDVPAEEVEEDAEAEGDIR